MSVLQFLRKNKRICLVLGFVLTLGLGFAVGFFVARKTGISPESDYGLGFGTAHHEDGELGISFDYLKDYDLYKKEQLEEKGLEGLAGLEKKKAPHITCLVTRVERPVSIDVPYEALKEYIRTTLGSDPEAKNLEIEPYEAKSYSGAKVVYEFDTLEVPGGVLGREMVVFATPKNTYSLFCTSFASELKYFAKEFEVFFKSFEGT